MEASDQDYGQCNTLFVTEGNFLDDSVESGAHRELFRALAGLGMPCQVVCRFLVWGEQETEPGPWLGQRGWKLETVSGRGDAPWFALPSEESRTALRVMVHGVPVTLFRGSSTKLHVPDDAERAAFLRLVGAALDGRRPQVVVARSGPCLADVLAAARARHSATVAL
jgi:hypothetical protein